MTGKIVPRFQLRSWTIQDFQALISSLDEAKTLSQQIVSLVVEYEFDGIVLECGYPTMFRTFLQTLSQQLHQWDKELILVLSPIRTEQDKRYLNPVIFNDLATFVDRFSLMTYDYSSHRQGGGPSAPVDWIINNIEYLTEEKNRYQLLIGLNMYAMSYSATQYPEPLVMKDVLQKLGEQQSYSTEDSSDIIWDKQSEEHYFQYQSESDIGPTAIWMPTLTSIQNRIRIADDYGGKILEYRMWYICH
ncbi:Chitinase domain-containing protein 1 [Apophysomyces sp. BC1034]|nr:Chitinase domain-containing protein 1 [Apophysomyces sp. BC1034]